MKLFAAGFLLCAAVCSAQVYKNVHAPVEDRIHDLLQRLTVEEKTSLLAGSGWMESTAVPRLGIPAIKMADGPMGIRNWVASSAETNAPNAAHHFSSTAFPASVGIGASWDPELAKLEGKTIGEEVRAIGRDMILAPTVNIQRVPLWGRNFEGYGEDPFLTARMGVAYIEGVQGEGVIPSVKHFVANNEEFERHRIDAAIDERTLHEIYLPAFEATVKEAKVWTVMSAYNKVNGSYNAENPLLKSELVDRWGFGGFIISDWGSTYSTAPTVNAGMSLEMPGGAALQRWVHQPRSVAAGNDGGYLTTEKVLPLVKSGTIPMAKLDDNVARLLRVLFVSGIYDKPHVASGEIDTPAQRRVARRAADEAIVLLKNDGGVLPLDAKALKSIAVIGPNAGVARTGGGGSSMVWNNHVVSPLDGLKAHGVEVNYALGVAMAGDDPTQDTPEMRAQLRSEAVAAAKKSDVAIVFVGYSDKYERESEDRKTMDLPDGQDALVEAVLAANPKTIVVFNAGDPVTITRWAEKAPAIMDAFYGGEEGGNAVADVLFGDFNPSGKLPFSFVRSFKDSPAAANYPGEKLHVKYAEGIYVGYRYFDKQADVKPLFAFGHGLSYTHFAYSDLHATDTSVSVRVKNDGSRAGAEVVQVYLSEAAPAVDRPVKELKGFARVQLAAGEAKTVTILLNRRAFSYWDVKSHDWIVKPGRFSVMVGAASDDVRLKSVVVK